MEKLSWGDQKLSRWISAVVFDILWLLYIGISSWRVTEIARERQPNITEISNDVNAYKDKCIEIVHFYRHNKHREIKEN